MMKWLVLPLSFLFCFCLPVSTKAQDPILELVKGATKKIIKAVDLMVQRLQNETIWLQNAQKTVENILSETKLNEISDWVEKHREQYAGYFDELNRVKTILSGAKEVKQIIKGQVELVNAYKEAMALFKGDNCFSVADIEYMEKVYTGIIDESLQHLDELATVIQSFSYQMTDEERLAIIKAVKEKMDEHAGNLRAFTTSNKMLRINQTRDAQEVKVLKAYYEIKE